MSHSLVYLDNAATTVHKPCEVVQAVTNALTSCGNPGRSAHQHALQGARVVHQARMCAAQLFGLNDPRNVAFFLNATDALNAAIHGMIEPGMHVVTTAAEHNSVLRPLYRAQQEQHIQLTIVNLEDDGTCSHEALLTSLTPDVDVVVVGHASNVTGNSIDIQAVAQRAHEVGARIIVDAAQTAGVLPIQCDEWGIDALAFTGHKSLFGPQGTGGLCLQSEVRCRPWRCGGDGTHSTLTEQPAAMPDRLEAGTLNVPGIAGLLAGMRSVMCRGIDDVRHHDLQLTRYMLERVEPLVQYGLRLHGSYREQDLPARVPVWSYSLGDMDMSQVSDYLMQEYQICTRAGLHCAPLMHQALQTYERGALRVSCSAYTTLEEVDTFCCALEEIVKNNHRGRA